MENIATKLAEIEKHVRSLENQIVQLRESVRLLANDSANNFNILESQISKKLDGIKTELLEEIKKK